MRRPIDTASLGPILPHEHLFTDLRGPHVPNYPRGDPAQMETEVAALKEAVRRGAYVELDSVGAPLQSQEDLIATVLALLDAGFEAQLLLSHDAGWYNPAHPDGLPDDGYRGYTALIQDFTLALMERAIKADAMRGLTVDNPAHAFSF